MTLQVQCSPRASALAAQIDGLSEMERQVLAYSTARLKDGQDDVGASALDDSADGFEEALKEIIDSTHYLTMELIRLMRARDRRSRPGGLRKVYLCHRPASESRAAQRSLRQVCAGLVSQGSLPVCPQILFSVLLQDGLEHEIAHLVCADLLRICDEVCVYGAEMTPDMQLEVKLAQSLDIPVRFMHPAAEVA